MIETLMIVIGGLFGAVGRRIFGGWLGFPRSLCTLGLVIISATPFWFTGLLNPWFTLPFIGIVVPKIVMVILITVSTLLHWVDGVRFDLPFWGDRKSPLLRYSYYAPLFIALFTGFWPVLVVGPLVAAGYYIAPKLTLPTITLPWDTAGQKTVDGPIALAEFWLGFVSVSAFWAAAFLM